MGSILNELEKAPLRPLRCAPGCYEGLHTSPILWLSQKRWHATRSTRRRRGEVWTWWEPIRTISEVPFEVQIPLSKPFLFQTLSEAAITLKHQGLSYLAISKILKIDDKTVKKAIERGKKLLWLLMMPFGRSP